MSLYSGIRIVAGLVAPGMLDLRSSTKKKNSKLKFPERKENKFVPKVYAKGSGTRKVND
jgi:hypothetical protein